MSNEHLEIKKLFNLCKTLAATNEWDNITLGAHLLTLGVMTFLYDGLTKEKISEILDYTKVRLKNL